MQPKTLREVNLRPFRAPQAELHRRREQPPTSPQLSSAQSTAITPLLETKPGRARRIPFGAY
eukprot:358707-Chlamydomonas_euryale.AAC.6